MAIISNDEFSLTELHRSGYEVAPGEADVRGWKVINADGQSIGEVVELLFDPASQSVRYLVVTIDGKPINLVSRDVLIPIGLADVVADSGIIAAATVTLGQLAALPTYKKSNLNNAFERAVRQVYIGNVANATVEKPDERSKDFYNHDHFIRGGYSNRHAAENNRSGFVENDNTTRERIIPKEKVAEDPNRNFTPFTEGAIEFTERKEVPLVTKQARVVEEIRVNRDVTERDEIVRDSVRRTEVDIERLKRKDQ